MHISRETYRKIKQMDKTQLEAFMNSYYVDAYNKGVSDVSSTITTKIDAGIRKTPGIGEKRYQEIMKHIVEELHSGGGSTQNDEMS